MQTEQILAVIRQMVREVLPDVEPDQVTLDASLESLGANSVDRADIATQSMEALGLRLSPARLAAAKDVGSLVALFEQSLADAGGGA